MDPRTPTLILEAHCKPDLDLKAQDSGLNNRNHRVLVYPHSYKEHSGIVLISCAGFLESILSSFAGYGPVNMERMRTPIEMPSCPRIKVPQGL